MINKIAFLEINTALISDLEDRDKRGYTFLFCEDVVNQLEEFHKKLEASLSDADVRLLVETDFLEIMQTYDGSVLTERIDDSDSLMEINKNLMAMATQIVKGEFGQENQLVCLADHIVSICGNIARKVNRLNLYKAFE
jgi:hypothetical protein